MGNDTAVVTASEEMLPEVITPASAPMKLDQMSQMMGYMEKFIQELLKPEVDFGIIPGTDKPSLYKAGAEKLCMAFGLSEEYKIVVSERDSFKEWEYNVTYYDKTQKKQITETKKSRGYYYFSVRCKLIHKGTGVVWASQIGDCESTERGRETAPSNTILKMAQKRAFVGATLHATFTSDRFTADMDTYDRPAPKGQPKKSAATPSDGSGFRMPFGKHKGEFITEIPTGYLQWCLDNMEKLNPETRKIIEAEVKRDRSDEKKSPDKPEPTDKVDPTRESLLKEIPELEAELGKINDEFRPMKSREISFGSTDITKSDDQGLIDYWTSLKSAINAKGVGRQ